MTFSRTQPLRIYLLDDHAIFLRGLNAVLTQEPTLKVMGIFSHSRDLWASFATTEADMLIMDHALAPQDTNGLNLIREVHLRNQSMRILVASNFYNSATVAQALRYGASGFISKTASEGELLNAVQVAGSGNIYLEPLMAMQLAQIHERVVKADRAPGQKLQSLPLSSQLSVLSPKVQDVMHCLLEGMTVTEIAEKFSRSIKTISGQKQAGMRKLGLKTDNELSHLRDSLQRQRR